MTRLSNLGVVPGAAVRLQQRRPDAVLRIGETTLVTRPAETGEINGDRIEGTFTSVSGRPGVGRSTGWWEVTRKKLPSS